MPVRSRVPQGLLCQEKKMAGLLAIKGNVDMLAKRIETEESLLSAGGKRIVGKDPSRKKHLPSIMGTCLPLLETAQKNGRKRKKIWWGGVVLGGVWGGVLKIALPNVSFRKVYLVRGLGGLEGLCTYRRGSSLYGEGGYCRCRCGPPVEVSSEGGNAVPRKGHVFRTLVFGAGETLLAKAVKYR